MNREAEEFRISSDIKEANNEVLRGRLEQAEHYLAYFVDNEENHEENLAQRHMMHEEARQFLASQQDEQATSAEIARVHPEQADGDIETLVRLLRHGDAMPGEQDLAADHLERLLRIEKAEGAQGEREGFATWWNHAAQWELRKSCAMGWGEKVWRAARAALAQPSPAGEFGDAYQGAREDLAIWKRRALEAEQALREEKILTERLGNALNDDNGPTFMGEPNVAQPSPAQELERGSIYVEARECIGCGHSGINDATDGFATCSACAWIGKEPVKDECPKCQRENVMSVACPMCHCRYILIADGHIKAPVAQAGLVPEGYVLLPLKETEPMHDAVMSLLYKGIGRQETQKLLDAYIAAAPAQGGSADE